MAAGKNPIDPRTYVYISSNCVTYSIRDNVRESKLDWLDCKNCTKDISFQMFLVFFVTIGAVVGVFRDFDHPN